MPGFGNIRRNSGNEVSIRKKLSVGSTNSASAPVLQWLKGINITNLQSRKLGIVPKKEHRSRG